MTATEEETLLDLFERCYDIPEVARFTLHESWTALKRYTHLWSEPVPEKAAPPSFKPQEVRH